jgi:CBS domain-containing protein
MKKVNDILTNKSDKQSYSVAPNNLVWDAISLMTEKGVGALLVIENNKLVGVVSERDYMRKVALMGRSSQSTQVHEIMTPNPITVTPDEDLNLCMQLMTDMRIRHLPVVTTDKIFGMLSIRDLLQSIMEEQQHLIEQLEQYIRGESY